jgi:hypothetical protein
MRTSMSTVADSLRLALELILHADPALLQVVGLSLQVSGTACLIGASAGLVLGAWLAVARFPGQRAVVWALNTLLALPSVVVGLAVYLLLSRSGPLGFLGWLFSFKAMVLAQALLVELQMLRARVQEHRRGSSGCGDGGTSGGTAAENRRRRRSHSGTSASGRPSAPPHRASQSRDGPGGRAGRGRCQRHDCRRACPQPTTAQSRADSRQNTAGGKNRRIAPGGRRNREERHLRRQRHRPRRTST